MLRHRPHLFTLLIFILLLAACGGAVAPAGSGGSGGNGGSNGSGGSGNNGGSGGNGGQNTGSNNTGTSNASVAICGDGACNHGETSVFCPQDCPVVYQCDSDGNCEQPGENAVTCAADCAEVGGFPNIQRSFGYISGPFAEEQGRSALLAFHGKTLIMIPETADSAAGSDYRMRTWSIESPENPEEIAVGEETTNPVNAHGYLFFGNQLHVGWTPNPAHPQWVPLPGNSPQAAHAHMAYISNGNSVSYGPWTSNRRSGTHGTIYPPWEVTTYTSYQPLGNQDATVTLTLNGVNQTTSLDVIGDTGVVGHPFILGNLLLYASDQSDSGVVSYDISNPAAPQRLDVLKLGQIGGYEPEIWGHYLVFPKRPSNGGAIPGRMQMVDFSDPSNLRLACEVDLPSPRVGNQYITEDIPYVQFQDEYGFINSYKIDMRTCTVVSQQDLLGTGQRIDCSQFVLPIGNLMACGGLGGMGTPLSSTGRLQGVSIFAHQATPDIRGPEVAYHIPRDGQANYPVNHSISVLIHETLRTESLTEGQNVILRNAATGAAVDTDIFFTHNDVLTIDPVAALSANTTYEVILRGIEDVSRNPMSGTYSFRFSTGSSVTGAPLPSVEFSLSPAQSEPFAPGSTVIFNVTTDATGASCSFDFGDGSSPTGWLTTCDAGHIYSEPGHYTVEMRVRDANGRVSLETTTITVNGPIASLPNQSSQLLCNDGRHRAWAVNPDDNSVSVLDLASGSLVSEIPLAGADPRSIAMDRDGNVWVALHDSDRIAIIDPDDLNAAPTYISTGYGTAPYAIVMHPGQNYAYVSLFGSGELIRINTSSPQTAPNRITLGPTPRALALNPDGSRLYVTRFISGPHFGEVWTINTATFSQLPTIQLLKSLNDDAAFDGKGVPNYLADILVSPDGTRAWVTAKKDNTDAGLINANDVMDSDNTVRALLMTLNLQTGAEIRGDRIDIDNSDSPSGMAMSPYGDYLFLAMQGNNQTIIFDALEMAVESNFGTIVTRLSAGGAPQDVCVDEASRSLVTKNLTGRSVSVADADPLFSVGNFNLSVSEVETVVAHPVMATNVLRGKAVFYNASDTRMSGEGYISCATCHIDGSHDGRTWDFTQRGEGLRNTITLEGRAGTGHGPVHWTANFDEIQDFEHDIRNAFGGEGFLTDSQFTFGTRDEPLGDPKAGLNSDLDAMAAYLASLDDVSIPRSPYRDRTTGNLTAAAQAGQTVFEDAGCDSCHRPEDGYTDSIDENLHDVATLRDTSGERLGQALTGIDTPTLLGLHSSAPYGHDGSATTLGAFLANTGGDVYEAEDTGAFTRGGSPTVHSNNNAYSQGGASVQLTGATSLTMSGVDGGNGANRIGQIRIRYATVSSSARILLTVNGVSVTMPTLQTIPVHPEVSLGSNFQHWYETDSIPITFTTGATNTIQLRANAGGTVNIDSVTISTPADVDAADAHRAGLPTTSQGGTLTQTEHNNLIQFLLQLDGNGPF